MKCAKVFCFLKKLLSGGVLWNSYSKKFLEVYWKIPVSPFFVTVFPLGVSKNFRSAFYLAPRAAISFGKRQRQTFSNKGNDIKSCFK